MSREVNSCFNSTVEVVHKLLLDARPRIIDHHNDCDDLLVKFNSVWIVLNLIIKVEKRILEYFLLTVRYSVFFGVVTFSDVIFESGEDHDEEMIFLVWDEPQ